MASSPLFYYCGIYFQIFPRTILTPELQNKKILIVDDDPDIRNFISINLKRKGHITIQSSDASEAMNNLMENEVKLILCDIDMHGMNGYEFLQLVKKKPQYQKIPFIFITSHSSKDDKIKAYSMGADNFISKPFNTSEFIAIVESSLKRVEIRDSYGSRQSYERPAEGAAARVMLVDDEPFLAELLKAALEQDGMECIYCDTAAEAISRAHDFKPGLIISDYNMPDVDGFGFRKMVLSDSKLKDIPFVFFTSNEEENVALQGFDLNIKDFILKKTSIKITVAKIRNLLASAIEERRSTLGELQEAASEISLELLPDLPSAINGCRIEYWHQPFKDVPGGDFIDFIEAPDGRKILVFGDMMGKKWGAWFYTFSFISYIRSTIRVLCNTGDKQTASGLLQSVNAAIYNDSKVSQIFSAISLIIFSEKGNELQYSGAGDLPVFHFSRANGKFTEYESSGILLGARENGKFDNITIPLEAGDTVMLFTDGMLDSVNNVKEVYGLNSLRACFQRFAPEGGLLEKVKSDFVAYTNNDFADDVTLITLTGINP